MKVYLNKGYVDRRSTVGKWASLLGLVVLGGGLFISLAIPQLFFVSLITLLLGFILSNVGIYYANRYVRLDRPDAVLAQGLKGLDNRYVLYQFRLPVSQVLCEPGGLTIFVLKTQEGQVLYQQGKWRNKQGWGRLLRWIGQEGLGKPELEVENEVQALEEWPCLPTPRWNSFWMTRQCRRCCPSRSKAGCARQASSRHCATRR